ncbi:hypothetical protein CENSYa_1836 [Cenarchaeum symbiosum A]|uniref:SpoVT-AbrB domain-containing protein n=1 Tax=Cenarchaeum symbiosum (strain A) TaxID=414004 RepID=A0RYM9_CENSY|nr:hypothetical protein CENSYa_1836 [Cenarchaeum symbiosum A]
MEEDGHIVKITSGGTVSLPKQYRKYMDMQKGDYVRITIEEDRLVVKKVTMS